jgi:hypothetical protein
MAYLPAASDQRKKSWRRASGLYPYKASSKKTRLNPIIENFRSHFFVQDFQLLFVTTFTKLCLFSVDF